MNPEQNNGCGVPQQTNPQTDLEKLQFIQAQQKYAHCIVAHCIRTLQTLEKELDRNQHLLGISPGVHVRNMERVLLDQNMYLTSALRGVARVCVDRIEAKYQNARSGPNPST